MQRLEVSGAVLPIYVSLGNLEDAREICADGTLGVKTVNAKAAISRMRERYSQTVLTFRITYVL